jgi:hypothetical protein
MADLYTYEHAYLRLLHPKATDAQVAYLVHAYAAELDRRLAVRNERDAHGRLAPPTGPHHPVR